MQIEVDMSYEQYFEANRLMCLKTTSGRKWNFLFMWYGCPVLCIGCALFAVLIWIWDRQVNGSVWIEFGASAYFLWCRLYFPIKIRKCYGRNRSPKKVALNADGIHVERKDASVKADFTWSAFESWIERPDMFLAFHGHRSFVCIPKDKLTDAEQNEVRGWLSAASKRLT